MDKATGKKRVLDAQVHNLFSQAPVAIAVFRGKNHVVEIANDLMLQLWGRGLENVLNKPLFEGLPDAKGQGFEQVLDNVYKTGNRFIADEAPASLLRHGRMEDIFVKFVFEPLRDEEGNISGIMALADEITEPVTARKKTEENEERLRLAVETTRLGTWEFLPLTGKLTWSDECKRIYQFPLDRDVDYGLFSEHVFPDDRDFAQGAIQKAMDPNGSGNYNIEYRILRFTDKSVRWIRAVGKVFFNDQKEPTRFLGTVLDITESKLREEILRLNEERLRLAVESGRLGTYELDMLKNTLICSSRLAEIFGLDHLKNNTQRDFRNAIHPEDVHIRNEAHRLAKRTGSLFYEVRAIWPDGSVHWIRLNGRVVFDNYGKALRTYGTALDITEQKEKEKILKESEEKFRLIAEAVPHMVWEIQLNGVISYINKQWSDWSGLTLEEINTGGWARVFHPEDAEKVARGWTEAFEGNQVYIGECRIKNPDGGYSWFTLKTVPVKNKKGKVELWIGTATDIHDKKIAEQQKDEFFRMVSHELKTPVTTIKAYGQISENILEKKGDEETLHIVKKMGSQVKRLTTLIGDLLDITKIQNGKLLYNEAFFDFNELVMEIIDDTQGTSQTHIIKSDLGTNAEIYGDREKIGQVITNLISNAIKYSPLADQIIISTRLEKSGVRLGVEDFGIGISGADQKHVFEQFYRVNENNQQTFPGMGIGLYISSEIIKRHGGKIGVKSVLNEGSIFYSWLPFDHRNGIA